MQAKAAIAFAKSPICPPEEAMWLKSLKELKSDATAAVGEAGGSAAVETKKAAGAGKTKKRASEDPAPSKASGGEPKMKKPKKKAA